MGRFKRYLDKWMDVTLKLFVRDSTPSSIHYACKRFPKYRYLWWFLYQLKDNLIFIIFVWMIYTITHWCNPLLLCEPCLNITNSMGAFDTNTLINFNNSIFDNVTHASETYNGVVVVR